MITQTETVVMLSACALRLRADAEGKSVGMIHQAPGAPTGTGRQFSAALISLAFSDFSTRFPARFHGTGVNLFAHHPLVDLRDLQNAFEHEESLPLMQGRFFGFLQSGDESTLSLNCPARLGYAPNRHL
jgi:hypothetical protein